MADGGVDGLTAQPHELVHVVHTTRTPARRTMANLPSALPSSTHERSDSMRLKPDTGFSRERSGTSAPPLNDQPPSASGAPSAATQRQDQHRRNGVERGRGQIAEGTQHGVLVEDVFARNGEARAQHAAELPGH